MTELEFAKKIRDAGGTAYLVGGAVRDKFRNVEAHDRDYCVTGIDEKFSDFPCNVDANCQIRRLKISRRERKIFSRGDCRRFVCYQRIHHD